MTIINRIAQIARGQLQRNSNETTVTDMYPGGLQLRLDISADFPSAYGNGDYGNTTGGNRG